MSTRSTLTVNAQGKVQGLKSFDFTKEKHVDRFIALSMDDKRKYIGWYMRTNNEAQFMRAMLLVRPAKSLRPDNIQREIQRLKSGTVRNTSAYDMFEFIAEDYKPHIHFDMFGHTLLEVAAIMDAKRATGQSQRMLKKVLDDLHYLVKAGKKVTVLPSEVKLGHTILQHGQNATRRQQTLREIMDHPVMRGKTSAIINTHHRHNGTTKHLATLAKNKYGNTSTHNFIQKHSRKSTPLKKKKASVPAVALANIGTITSQFGNMRVTRQQAPRSINSPRTASYNGSVSELNNQTNMQVQNRGRRGRNTGNVPVTNQLNEFASIVNTKTRGPVSVDNLLRAQALQQSINGQFNSLSPLNKRRYAKLYDQFGNTNNSNAASTSRA